MIDKKTFCEALDAVQKQNEIDVKFANNLSVCFPSSFSANLLPNTETCVNALLKLLKHQMSDKYDWIVHFCWELNFGAENYRLEVKDKNGKLIPMSNSSELYDFMIKEYEKK